MEAQRRFAAVAAALAVTLGAGCSSDESSTTGSPPQTEWGSAAPSDPDSGASAPPAPDVAHPLPLPENVKQDPCSLLSSAQLATLGVPDDDGGGTRQSLPPAGIQCAWSNGAAKTSTSVGWETANDNGLQDIYAQRGEMGYFIPVIVQGFPGVLGTPADSRAYGDCSLHVGINEQDVMLVQYAKGGGPWRASCEKAKRAAGAVLEKLKRGAE